MSLAVVACIFSLVGFESATALGREAKNPLRNVPRAVLLSLILTGLFMVFMGYVEVFGTRHYGTPLGSITAPLNVLASIYDVSYFKIPISLCAMISFFSLSLSCLNAGARIIYPMGEHLVFPRHLGRAHADERDPARRASASTSPIMFAIPTILEIVTNPVTIFGDAGTLAAFGFLCAYFLISVAAPVYLAKRRRTATAQRRHHGGGLPVPAGADGRQLLPGAAATRRTSSRTSSPRYMAVGGAWLFIVSRRQRGILAGIEADLDQTLLLTEHQKEASLAAEAEA